MEFQKKTKRLLLITAAVIYVLMFIIAVLCVYKVYYSPNAQCTNCCCEFNNQTKQHTRKVMKSIDKCLEVLAPANGTMGKCEWLALKDSAKVGEMDSYIVEETKEIPADKLLQILDEKFYIEPANIVNSGIYSPIVRVSYVAANGKNITLVYSFSNAQMNLYRNNEMVKEAMLYNPNELSELLESII